MLSAAAAGWARAAAKTSAATPEPNVVLIMHLLVRACWLRTVAVLKTAKEVPAARPCNPFKNHDLQVLTRRRVLKSDGPAARSSAGGECEAEPIRNGRLEDTDDRHLSPAGPPGSCRDERLRRPDREVRDRADDERRDDGRHADREEERHDRDEASDGRRHTCGHGRPPRIREGLLAEAELLVDERSQKLLRLFLEALCHRARFLG